MATKTFCDGCGAAAEKALQIGWVFPRDYCETCAPVVQALFDELDQLHTEVATDYKVRREAIIETFREAQPRMKLPDE